MQRLSKTEKHRAKLGEEEEKILNGYSKVRPNKNDIVILDRKRIAMCHLLFPNAQIYSDLKKNSVQHRIGTFAKMIPRNYKRLDLTCRECVYVVNDKTLSRR